jgi:murein endopeptidase
VAGKVGLALALGALLLALHGPSPAAGEGRLRDGVQFPADSFDFATWDPVLKRTPDRWWRRWGTPETVDRVQLVLREYGDDHPDGARVLVGDLSRPHGGLFGARYGGLGHTSHQTGLDVDVYYPRRDRRERAALHAWQVDRRLAQELVHRFVESGAIRVYVGPSLHLRGPRPIVRPLIYHDDHLHVRYAPSSD